MTYLVVLPVIDPAAYEAWAALSKIPRDRLVIVDNSLDGIPLGDSLGFAAYHRQTQYVEDVGHLVGVNLGVARSWNIGRAEVLHQAADWLVIASTSVRFGPPGGLDFLDRLGECAGSPGVRADATLGWHFIALASGLLARTGWFDENFYPAYFEEDDYIHRMHLDGIDTAWPFIAPVDAEHINAQSLQMPEVSDIVRFGPLAAYYRSKWGGNPKHEAYKTPFDHAALAPSWWPPRVNLDDRLFLHPNDVAHLYPEVTPDG